MEETFITVKLSMFINLVRRLQGEDQPKSLTRAIQTTEKWLDDGDIVLSRIAFVDSVEEKRWKGAD